MDRLSFLFSKKGKPGHNLEHVDIHSSQFSARVKEKERVINGSKKKIILPLLNMYIQP